MGGKRREKVEKTPGMKISEVGRQKERRSERCHRRKKRHQRELGKQRGRGRFSSSEENTSFKEPTEEEPGL